MSILNGLSLTAMRYSIFYCFFIMLKLHAQNLVPNPSFEAYEPCGTSLNCENISQDPNSPCYTTCCTHGLPELPGKIISGTKNWWAVSRENYLSVNTPLYVNECIINTWIETQAKYGNRVNTDWYMPRTGKAYILIRTFGSWELANRPDTDTRDYAQVRLTKHLERDCLYEVSCYVLNRPIYDNFFNYTSQGKQCADGLGLYFSTDSVYRANTSEHYKAFTDITPQVSNPSGNILTDSINYQKVSGVFTASGGEEWLVIGNFKDNAHTQALYNNLGRAVYAVDDISVQEWKPDLVSFTDTTLCADSTLTITLPEGLKEYKWSTGETARQITIAAGNGRYTVEASNGCTILRDTFYLHAVPRYTALDLGKDTFFCKIPAQYALTSPVRFDSYLWSNGAGAAHISITQPGTYWLEGTYSCGVLTDTITVSAFEKPDTILLPAADTALCSNAFLDIELSHAAMYDSYQWNNGSAADRLRIHHAGMYSIQAYTPEGCEVLKKNPMIYPPANIHISDTLLCSGMQLIVAVPEQAGYTIRWYDGTAAVHSTIYQEGDYWVDIENRCYTVSDTFQVHVVDCALTIPNLITVNGDHKNDFFEIQTTVSRTLEIVLYSSWGRKVYASNDYKNDWNAEGLDAGLYYYQITDSVLRKKYTGWIQVIK
ncbi:Por secretion system C-terminal sorting domain-containing protein [Cytophaga hutchinsonii ATCC 33406]|nr:Por secretion system C-terminal sorting domain-containing protein [Cytophaga hutchinsonii ATCC 33406]